MTQVSRGRPGVALPIRIHDFLLSLAGRLDDDALGDARQMLASAELDRSLEFVAGCLAAGGVVVTGVQHRELEALFADTYLDPSVIDRVIVRDGVSLGRHRFAVGAVEGREPDRGVHEAIKPVLEVLPDVRSVWCVWRLTPAGPVSGPVPHKVVLVGVGPGGFAPATAYRVEYALRRAGIRASVEVLVDGNQPTDYHQEAMRCARQIPFTESESTGRSVMSPVEPVRSEPFEAPRVVEPARPFVAEPAPPAPPPAPAPAPASSPFAGDTQFGAEPQRPLPPIELPHADAARPAPKPSPVPRTELTVEPVAEPASSASARHQPAEEKPPASALSIETPTNSRPSPRRRSETPKDERSEPPSRPRLVPASPPAAPPVTNQDDHSAALVDEMLNTQERNLLHELQEELARRESQDQSPSSSGSWRIDRSGRHGKAGGQFDSARASGGPMMVNGVPPHSDGRGGGYPAG
ncbi:MAG: hypothetical protein GEV28_32240 [Actinophytocola sp.]|uniref:hypothetical protein n=1 Tax=Actinophytocola sp. TaxID=1872138 RepID=UPI00132C68E6|nr:hypothetical protein [Actinophytocola sp.]MPZ84804.1 hypothetical protein [Actinophytocola sp.]